MIKHQLSDRTIPYTGEIPSDTYHQFCKNIYSQNGEDGIIEALLKDLGVERGTFCEFGAGNGIYCSNTLKLIQTGNFRGIAIEPDLSKFKKLQQNYASYSNVQIFNGMVTATGKSSLYQWLKRGKLPLDLDLLSIDIDGDDYNVWNSLVAYHPKIVIIETNPYRDPVFEELPGTISAAYKDLDPLTGSNTPNLKAAGCSFMSTIKLGMSKGYIPIAFTGNVTFIRADLCERLSTFPYFISENPHDYISLYTALSFCNDKWFTNIGLMTNAAIGICAQRLINEGKVVASINDLNWNWINDRVKSGLKE
jgi:hypothetical protein